MQDIIKQFNRETVPLLLKRWPERFKMFKHWYEPLRGLQLLGADEKWRYVDCESLDSLAAIAEACGVVTEAHSLCPGKTWYGLYYWGDGFDNSTRVGGYPTELAARLAATIAAIAAIAGGGK